MSQLLRAIIVFPVLCLASAALAETVLQVPEPGVLRFFDGGSQVELKPGGPNTVNLKTPALLSIVNRVPLLIVPIFSKDAVIKLDPPMLAAALETKTEVEISNRLSKIWGEMADIQNLIRNRKLDQAQAQLNALQGKFPDIKFFVF